MAANADNPAPLTGHDVLLYIPNLIGYGRVLAAMASFVIMVVSPDSYMLAVGLYLASFVSDMIDGWAARTLGQTSCFGGVLDMITDRCGTAGFLFVLAGEYQSQPHGSAFRLLFLSLMLLDISSHWVQVCVCVCVCVSVCLSVCVVFVVAVVFCLSSSTYCLYRPMFRVFGGEWCVVLPK
jgi:phosphatidylserine synthase